jgi:glutamyl-Q tRNA(Asp) synthetase
MNLAGARATDHTGPYRGRFAPSPTGPLHFGSLVAAVASWLDARARGGSWLVRIEDVDVPRTVPGAAGEILRTLEAAGLEWDEEVLYQSRRTERYEAALESLRAAGRVFGCRCTRREIADSVLSSDRARRYPGTCRGGLPPGVAARAWRFRVEHGEIRFADRLQGEYAQDVDAEVGDFLLRRADGLFAYQLAVVVDDADQRVSDVVRGVDLLDSTPRQIQLQRALGLPRPRYLHLPVAVNAAGEKLSKQTRAPAIRAQEAAGGVVAVLDFLGHPPPEELSGAPAGSILAWAREHWSVARVPAGRTLRAPTTTG